MTQSEPPGPAFVHAWKTEATRELSTGDLCNDCGDQRPGFWDHNLNVVRATVVAGDAFLHNRSYDEWPHCLEYRGLVEEGSFQSHRCRHSE